MTEVSENTHITYPVHGLGRLNSAHGAPAHAEETCHCGHCRRPVWPRLPHAGAPAVPLQTASYWVPLASHHQAGPDQARQLPSGAPSLEETQAAGDSWRELCDKHQGTALVLTRTHACVIKNSRAVGITVFPGSDRGRVAPGSSRRGLCGWGGLCGRRSTVDY